MYCLSSGWAPLRAHSHVTLSDTSQDEQSVQLKELTVPQGLVQHADTKHHDKKQVLSEFITFPPHHIHCFYSPLTGQQSG